MYKITGCNKNMNALHIFKTMNRYFKRKGLLVGHVTLHITLADDLTCLAQWMLGMVQPS